MFTLGILQADQLYPDLVDDYQSYGHMFAASFEKLSQQDSLVEPIEIRFYQIQQGQYPQSFDECDGYLLTGSKSGVYDNQPWIAPLKQWLIGAYQAKVKLLGICFGHQMLAHSLGGLAAKSDKGWGVGVRTVQMQSYPTWLSDCPSEFSLIYSHKDQVQSLPPEARCLAGDDFCPNAAFYIEQQVLAIQGHPEFDAEFTRRLLGRRQDVIGQPTFDHAMQSLNKSNDSEMLIRCMMEFLRY